MPAIRPLLLLLFALLASLSCTALAQSQPPPFTPGKPALVRNDASSEGGVSVEVHVWQRDYPVPGSSLATVRANLASLHLGGAQGDLSAYTKWDLRWTLHYGRNAGGCSIAGAAIEVDAVLTLPAIEDESPFSPAALAEWYRYLAALKDHELAHVDAETSAATALQQELASLGPAPDCDALRQQVDALGERQKQAIRDADAALDAKTEHGALTGATFR